MPLYLMRHGRANPGADDRARELTPDGRALVAREAAGMEAAGYVPSRIVSSPYPRALQTAEAVAARFGLPVETDDALALDAGAEGIAALWERVKGETPAPLFVGHQPDLEHALERITGTRVSLPKGAIAVVTQDRDRAPVFSKLLLAETLAAFAPAEAPAPSGSPPLT